MSHTSTPRDPDQSPRRLTSAAHALHCGQRVHFAAEAMSVRADLNSARTSFFTYLGSLLFMSHVVHRDLCDIGIDPGQLLFGLLKMCATFSFTSG